MSRKPPPLQEIFTLTVVDVAIQRGTLAVWIRLRSAALADPKVLGDIRMVCEAQIADRDDPWLAGHRAWLAYMDSAMTGDEDCSRLRNAFTGSGGLP